MPKLAATAPWTPAPKFGRRPAPPDISSALRVPDGIVAAAAVAVAAAVSAPAVTSRLRRRP